MNPAATVHLRTLHLRGAAGEVAEARARLPAQLAQVTWPPQAEDRSVVVVRRVWIEGTPGELAARMAEAVHRLAARAVSADSPEADTAEAVRFDDRNDCTARLVHDLLRAIQESVDRVQLADEDHRDAFDARDCLRRRHVPPAPAA